MNETSKRWPMGKADKKNLELNQQELVEDLKNSLSTTIEDTSELLNNIITTIDESIMDENIRIESKDIITELRIDFSRTLNTTFEKISDSVDNGEDKQPKISKSEEE
jgi:nucleoid DNA-binding protein